VGLAAFPLFYYYVSPYLIIEAAGQGIVAGSLIVFVAMFISALLVGRVFCGWVCPAGGLQRLCARARPKKFQSARRNWIKYLIWAPWIAIIVATFLRAGGIRSIDPFYQTYHGISIEDMRSLVLFLIIAAVIASLALVLGQRAFCHSFCWMVPFMILGRRLRNLGAWPSLRLAADNNRCVDCMACSKNCPMSLDVHALVQGPTMENDECILCGTCVDVCPKNAIEFSFRGGTT